MIGINKMMLTITSREDGNYFQETYNVETPHPETWARSVIKNHNIAQGIHREFVGIEIHETTT